MNKKRMVTSVVVAMFSCVAAGCGANDTPGTGSRTGRVFFVTPKNGDTIKPMTRIEFGNEGVTIAAVPPGELTPAQVRPGMTHYHLGVDTDCLPPGTVIPKADPWVHFGQGNNTIDMSLTPGQHKLVVQAGDDMHRTIAGLCETITVNVVP
jgi:hypothetical protein